MKHVGRIRLALGILACTLALGIGSAAFAQQQNVSEVDLWKMIIRDSIASYPRSCPCPYSANRAGRACGEHSAYSRKMGGPLMCYPGDIPDEQIARYRERMQQ